MATRKTPHSSAGQMSRIIGLYQMMLRRNIEHFFPDALLEQTGDRSRVHFVARGGPAPPVVVVPDPDGFGLELEWLGSRYRLSPGAPAPFAPAERHLVEMAVTAVDRRFRAIYDPDARMEDMFQYAIEDATVACALGAPRAERVTAALEALRLAALSTYENQRSATGVLLLGGENDPSAPERVNLPGAPRYTARLTALKSMHRICDGLTTLLLVDRRGRLAWPVDVNRWADQVQGDSPLPTPCPRTYRAHARATLAGGHVALVLSPAQEIKVLARGQLLFTFTDGRWRLLDIGSRHAAWRQLVWTTRPADLADRLFHAALNLAEQRRGALFVLLRRPADSLGALLAPEDRIHEEIVADDPDDPENASPRLAKKAMHHIARAQNLADLDATVLEALAGIDGAVVVDADGRLLSFGAILRVTPETILAPRAVEGARTTAALAASYHGPVLKVSEDGVVAAFLGGRRLFEF